VVAPSGQGGTSALSRARGALAPALWIAWRPRLPFAASLVLTAAAGLLIAAWGVARLEAVAACSPLGTAPAGARDGQPAANRRGPPRGRPGRARAWLPGLRRTVDRRGDRPRRDPRGPGLAALVRRPGGAGVARRPAGSRRAGGG